MGDVAMTVPVLRAFSVANPTIKITVISRPFFKPFFNGITNLSFFPFDEKKRHKGFLGLLRLYYDIRKLNIDAFADLHAVLRSQIIGTLFLFSGKKTAQVDKGRTKKKALTRPENKIVKQLPSMFERHVKVFAKLGFKIDLTNPVFPIKQKWTPQIQILVKENNLKKIGIAPFAQYDSKVYPIDLMQQVIEELSKNSNYEILLFGGGKNEITILESLSKQNHKVINTAGKLKFEDELILISNLDMMLSMDSGNAHIAAMLGVNVITLWGATHPFSGFSPFNQPIENALVSDRNQFPKLPTSVYGNKKVVGYEGAMRSISVDKIVRCIDFQLSN